MTEYLTLDTDIDIGRDIEELLIKNQKLCNENENLGKIIREKEHTFTQKITELQMENDKLRRSNNSLEELAQTYKANKGSNVEETAELEGKISDLENRLFLAEQSDMKMKRQNQALNIEISNLKIEFDKLQMCSRTINTESSALKSAKNAEEGFENLDEETKNLLNELINEIEELKKDKNEMSEKALNMLTEKEIETLEIREKLEDLKKKHSDEINKLMETIHDLKGDLEDRDFQIKESNQDENQSFNSDEARILLEKYKELEDEYEEFKKESTERENTLLYENEKLKKDIEVIESTYKNSIQELESEISKFKAEVNNEIEEYHYEKDNKVDNDNNKNIFIAEIENYQTQITNLEEIKEKTEMRYKEQIKLLNFELRELDQANNLLKQQKSDIEKDLNNLKNNTANTNKEIQEKHQAELKIREKEVIRYKDKIEFITLENENMRKDYELIKKASEKSKNEYKELNDKLKQIKENSDTEIRKWEEKYVKLEKKLENEKSKIIEQNKELLQKLNNIDHQQKEKRSNSKGQKNSLLNILESDEDGNDKAILLEQEISLLNNTISELNSKLKSFEKQKLDLEIFKKENSKLKSDFKEMKDTYEKQIDDLQRKAIHISTELHSSKKRASRGSSRGEINFNVNQMQVISDLEKNISRVNAENKYSNEKIEILTKEIENLKVLRNNDVVFFREEVRVAEEQAIIAKVSLATLAFEKDSEIIKYKNLYKKLRMKITEGTKNQNNKPSQLAKSYTVASKK